jgi:hypothetical protein
MERERQAEGVVAVMRGTVAWLVGATSVYGSHGAATRRQRPAVVGHRVQLTKWRCRFSIEVDWQSNFKGPQLPTQLELDQDAIDKVVNLQVDFKRADKSLSWNIMVCKIKSSNVVYLETETAVLDLENFKCWNNTVSNIVGPVWE